MSLSAESEKNLAAIYDKYADMLFRIALSHLQSSEDAQDAVHDVFVKYIKSNISFFDDEHERAWFVRVTVNRCYDMLRRKKVRNHIPLEEISEIIADESQNAENVIDVMRCLTDIPEKNKTAIILHYLEGFSVEKIASTLNVSVSAVKMRLLRGRELLKNLIDKEDNDV